MERLYRIGEIATLTAVPIRRLHYYHRIGLLIPSHYSKRGCRLYTEQDLFRLQQILTLRRLGYSYRQVTAIQEVECLAALRIQQAIVRNRITELERIEALLGTLLSRRLASGQWAWELLVQVSILAHVRVEEIGGKIAPK